VGDFEERSKTKFTKKGYFMKLRKSGAFKMIACASLSAAMLIPSVPSASAQDEISERKLNFGVKPLPDADMEALKVLPPKASLKTWTYSITSTRAGSKGNIYKGTMVGNSPITTNGTTTTTVYVVPLVVTIGTHTFDPTAADSSCLAGFKPLDLLKLSPMVLAYNDFKINGVDVGVTQYSDAFQRASFWKDVKAKGGTYHNKLNYKFLPAMAYNPPSSDATLYSVSGCTSVYGGIEVNAFDFVLKLFYIPGLASKGVGPKSLVTFMLYNTTMYDTTPTSCCIGGYHGAYNDTITGAGIQTYSPFQFDSAEFFGAAGLDTSIMSHEINEWQDDPMGNNPTPAWGHVGQVSGCQTNLEVGDPLTGTDIPVVPGLAINYHLQELAFFSWYYGAPSLGAGGKYSDHGTFKSAQGPCI
jgi:hypothetical protein